MTSLHSFPPHLLEDFFLLTLGWTADYQRPVLAVRVATHPGAFVAGSHLSLTVHNLQSEVLSLPKAPSMPHWVVTCHNMPGCSTTSWYEE